MRKTKEEDILAADFCVIENVLKCMLNFLFT